MPRLVLSLLFTIGCSACLPTHEVAKGADLAASSAVVAEPTRSSNSTLENVEKSAEDDQPRRRFRYELDYKSSYATMEVRINGALFFVTPGLSFSFGTGRISHWLHRGKNKITVDFKRTSTTRPAEAWLTVTKVWSKPRLVETVLRTEWSSDSAFSNHDELSVELNAHVPPCRFFEEAEKLTNDASTREQARAYAESLYRNFLTRKETVLYDMLSYSHFERARCETRPLDQARRTAKRYTKRLAAATNEGVDSPPPSEWQIDYVLDGRAFRISNAGNPLFKVTANDRVGLVDVYVGRIRGSWVLVR